MSVLIWTWMFPTGALMTGQVIPECFPPANIHVSLVYLFTKPVPTLVLLSPQGGLFPMSGSHSCYIINLKKEDPYLQIVTDYNKISATNITWIKKQSLLSAFIL